MCFLLSSWNLLTRFIWILVGKGQKLQFLKILCNLRKKPFKMTSEYFYFGVGLTLNCKPKNLTCFTFLSRPKFDIFHSKAIMNIIYHFPVLPSVCKVSSQQGNTESWMFFLTKGGGGGIDSSSIFVLKILNPDLQIILLLVFNYVYGSNLKHTYGKIILN